MSVLSALLDFGLDAIMHPHTLAKHHAVPHRREARALMCLSLLLHTIPLDFCQMLGSVSELNSSCDSNGRLSKSVILKCEEWKK